jgi:hypothetical protein
VNQEEVVRYAAILRGVESAWQAISYGVESIYIIAQVGGVYLNFGLWAVSIVPAWFVIRHFGVGEEVDSGDDTEVTNGSQQETIEVANDGKNL